MIFADIPQRKILGTRVSLTSYNDACTRILAAIRAEQSGYVAIANVHMVMTGYFDKTFQHMINQALLTTPDGMPLVKGLKWLGLPTATRVYGPDLTLHCCAMAAREKIPVYFYGSRPETLMSLSKNLTVKFPALRIVGMDAPPFRPLTTAEEQLALEKIGTSGAQIVFVGLGCPKQEQWMHKYTDQLPAILLGVGAAFDFHAGTVAQAPRWMMRLGLEWLYRLIQEPRRLWKRYVVNNSAFIVLFALQLLRYQWQSIVNGQSR